MSAAKTQLMEPEPHHARPRSVPEPWADVTTQLRRRGRAIGLTREDAEDRAQDAVIRLFTERPRAGAPPLEVRAARAHKLALVDAFRKSRRAKEVPAEARVDLDDDDVQALPVETDFEARLRLMELIAVVREEVGGDGLQLLLESEAGYTEAESAVRLRPAAPSTAALRKRISRAAPVIAARIINDLEGDR